MILPDFNLKLTILFLVLIFKPLQIYSQTKVGKDGEKWMLKVDGKPFEVKRVTFGYDEDVENYDKYFKDLEFIEGNTIRTWGTGRNTKKTLRYRRKI